MADTAKYRAFISYAHTDERWARWIHRRLEGFSLPRGMAAQGDSRHPLRPVFRDRDELSASTQLGSVLRDALEQSEALIVICSPRSAASPWVNEEIRHFRSHHGIDRIFPLIVDGEPYAGDAEECFPPALLEPDEDEGAGLEPLAADARSSGDGRQAAFLKIAAGLLGVGLDQLVRRESARRQQRLATISIASVTGMIFAAALAIYANAQRLVAVEQRSIAEREEQTARATVDYLVDTFRVANPATENPNTISALTILQRGAEGIASDLAGEPRIQAELYGAVGLIYKNLRLLDEAEAVLARGYELLDPKSPEAVENRLTFASVLLHSGKFDLALQTVNDVIKQLNAQRAEDILSLALAFELRGYVHRDMIDFSAALNDLDLARQTLAANGAANADAMPRIDSVRGLILTELGEYDTARQILEGVLRSQTENFSPDHFQVGVAHQNLAALEQSAGDLERAGFHLDNALRIFGIVLTPPHPDLGSLYLLRGQVAQDTDDLAAAIASFEAAAGQFEQIYPEGHYLTGYAYVYLALALSEANDFVRALKLLDAAVPQYRASYGETNPDFGDLAVHRGVVLARAGRTEEASAACLEGIGILDATLGSGASITADLRGWCVAEGALMTKQK